MCARGMVSFAYMTLLHKMYDNEKTSGNGMSLNPTLTIFLLVVAVLIVIALWMYTRSKPPVFDVGDAVPQQEKEEILKRLSESNTVVVPREKKNRVLESLKENTALEQETAQVGQDDSAVRDERKFDILRSLNAQ